MKVRGRVKDNPEVLVVIPAFNETKVIGNAMKEVVDISEKKKAAWDHGGGRRFKL